MTSQLSQPSSSISARVVGRNGAIPNRCAQYGRWENSAFDTARSFSTAPGRGLRIRRSVPERPRMRRMTTCRYCVLAVCVAGTAHADSVKIEKWKRAAKEHAKRTHHDELA